MKIFISYRRKSSSFMLLLAEKLGQELDVEIFIDLESIDDDDFERSIIKHLKSSDVFLLMVTEHTFSERIHEETDWVRKEILAAIESDMPIVLVCENGLIPPPDLPEAIQAIRGKQRIEFYPAYFDAAVSRLAKFLQSLININQKKTVSREEPGTVKSAEIQNNLPQQTEINMTNASQILVDAINAYDKDDYARTLFLLDALRDINYASGLISISALIEKVIHSSVSRIDTFYHDDDEGNAVKYVDMVAGYYAREHQIDNLMNLLETLVQKYPRRFALRQRLIAIYRRRGQKDRAIEQLDILGELQLDAGLNTDAARTIRQIGLIQDDDPDDPHDPDDPDDSDNTYDPDDPDPIIA